jgi:hypothetical protein
MKIEDLEQQHRGMLVKVRLHPKDAFMNMKDEIESDVFRVCRSYRLLKSTTKKDSRGLFFLADTEVIPVTEFNKPQP